MSSSEVKVGAITLGGAAILAAMITFLGTFSFGSDKYDITIDYPQVAGLMEGNMVRYAGVQVGTVKGLAVNEDGIEVTAEINDNVRRKICRYSAAAACGKRFSGGRRQG